MHHCLQHIFRRQSLLCSGIVLHGTCHPQLEPSHWFCCFNIIRACLSALPGRVHCPQGLKLYESWPVSLLCPPATSEEALAAQTPP